MGLGALAWVPLLAVAAVLVLVAPLWPWSRGWGWAPAGMVAVVLATIALFTLSVEPASASVQPLAAAGPAAG